MVLFYFVVVDSFISLFFLINLYFSNFILFIFYYFSPFGLFSPFFSFFCCNSVLPCCSCFTYIFIFPKIFSIFLFLFHVLFFVIVLSFFFFLLSHCIACQILVPRPGVRPELLWWECKVQTTGLTEKLRPQGILNRVRSPGSSQLSTKAQLYPTACKLQCWTTQAKQPVRQEHSINQVKKICYR